MSRHRFIKNLVEDDYYDDYDDDYYDDEYYEEEEYGSMEQQYAPPSKQPQQPQARNAPRHRAPPSISSTPTPAVAAGVAKPPPGWGKPAATSAKPQSGIAQPPQGWGKPAPASSSSKTSNERAASAGGVTKPPPGWGKPSSGTHPPAVVTSKGVGAGGISKPPPGWGKPDGTKQTATAVGVNEKSAPLSPGIVSTKQQQAKKSLPDFLKSSANRSQLSMVVVGHVDAGKSTLMGQLLVQVGQVTKRAATKQGAQLAWLLDEEESERERGVTMQIGTKTFSTANHDVVMLDAPGHADFIPIMITGAAHADVAILVIAATRGEFEAGFERGGQTKEHVILARGLGVSQIIVAINKLDTDDWWDEARYEEIKFKTREFLLQQQFGPKRIRFIPVSGLTGENVKQISDKNTKLKSWYKGPTLLEAIDSFQSANRHVDKPLRFVLTDVYAEGRGVIARGRVVQGYLQVDERLVVLPVGDTTTVNKLEHLQPPTFSTGKNSLTLAQQQQRLSIALAGDNVELVLTGIDPMRISVGNLLANSNSAPPICKKARAKVLVMDELTVPIIRGAQVLFHMHSLDVPAVLNKLIAITKRDGSIKKERPRALTAGASATVEFTLSDKICMETFAACRALGRFVLRRGGDTIAVGIIEELLQ